MIEHITIIVPVFNEEESLPQLRKALDQYLSFTPLKSCILFIDDGSTDSSLEKIKDICRLNHRYRFASLEKNQGLSTALKAGIDLVETPYIGYMDADLQTTPMDFMGFFKYLNGYDMVNGIRKNRNDTTIKKISSSVANRFRRMMINDGIEDTCCPLKVINTAYAKKIPFFKGMHRFIPALIQLQGGKVKQVEVSHFPRAAGKAKYHLLNRLISPFLDTLAVLWMKKNWIQYEIVDESKTKKQLQNSLNEK